MDLMAQIYFNKYNSDVFVNLKYIYIFTFLYNFWLLLLLLVVVFIYLFSRPFYLFLDCGSYKSLLSYT